MSHTHTLDSLGRYQRVTVVNEEAVREVAGRSDKPDARAVRDWVFETVLPELHGTAEPKPTTVPLPAIPEPAGGVAALSVFERDGHTVRVETRDGEPWFVLADLCSVLGLARKPAAVAERLDPKGVRQAYILTAGGKQQVTIVDEPRMYKVLMRSDKPDAVAVQDWIFEEVLPSIRKTGSYTLPSAAERSVEPVANPFDIMRRMVDQMEEQDRKVEEARAIPPSACPPENRF